jgi:hypothetical protein
MRLLKATYSFVFNGPGSVFENSHCEEKLRKKINERTAGTAR